MQADRYVRLPGETCGDCVRGASHHRELRKRKPGESKGAIDEKIDEVAAL